MLNDFLLIEELRTRSSEELFARLAELGDKAANEAEANLCEALRHYRRVIFLTHVPPFREACWHEGNIVVRTGGADYGRPEIQDVREV